MTTNVAIAPVSKSITVNAEIERAFRVFAEDIDTWWPRSHHIGKQPLQKQVIEPRAGGRCFGREADGTECVWGRVLVWEPPQRLVLAWQIDANWQFEPDTNKASEVEVRFTAEAGGATRVDLEHRYLERHGIGAERIRTAVDAPGGWAGLMQLYARIAPTYHPAVAPLALIFGLNDSLATRTFDRVADDQVWRRPTDRSNPMLWILGHMVNTRAQLLKILGEPFDAGWGDVFDRGAGLQEHTSYPTREAIQGVSRDVNARLFARLGALTDADLGRPATRAFTPAVRTVADQIAFLAMHDTYHVGQLAYVRKAIGYPGVVG